MDISTGDKVQIVNSLKLLSWRLKFLAGKSGVVTENLNLPNRVNKGYSVNVDGENWFVPADAVIAE